MNIDGVTREQVVNRTGEHVMTGHQRPGQAFFNALAELMPEVAEAIRGTDIDPFHESADAGGAKFNRAVDAMDAAFAAQAPRRTFLVSVPIRGTMTVSVESTSGPEAIAWARTVAGPKDLLVFHHALTRHDWDAAEARPYGDAWSPFDGDES